MSCSSKLWGILVSYFSNQDVLFYLANVPIQVTRPDERAPVEDARGQGPDRHGAGGEGQPASEEARFQDKRKTTIISRVVHQL